VSKSLLTTSQSTLTDSRPSAPSTVVYT
jgi:hypothetical protein